MGYCDPKWISDYNYQGVLNYRATQPLVMSAATAPMVQPCLLLWGHISNGELVLEPAFYIATRPRLPSQRGPYSIEARAADGTTLFALSFAPSEVADIPGSQQNYAFAVPLSAAKAARLSSLHLSGRGREAVLGAGIPPTSAPAAQGQAGLSADSVELRRAGGDRLRLRWNSSARPMVMVRDPDTGEVLSFARGGDIELSSSKNEVELIMSDGITSRAKRVRAAQ
jgi:hypothetical protein